MINYFVLQVFWIGSYAFCKQHKCKKIDVERAQFLKQDNMVLRNYSKNVSKYILRIELFWIISTKKINSKLVYSLINSGFPSISENRLQKC